MTEIERLRKQWRDNPTRKNLLAVADALYQSESKTDWHEALGIYRVCQMERGEDDKAMGLSAGENQRVRILCRRICAKNGDALKRDMPNRLGALPGIHQELDDDRNYIPRDVGEGWRHFGTHKSHEEGVSLFHRPLVAVPGMPWLGQVPAPSQPVHPGQIVLPDGTLSEGKA